ncbi:hypothetical protein ACFWSO_35645, partial [Streptomyces sp. NPDC058572]
MSSPSRRREMPVQIRCERAVRAKDRFTPIPTRTALLTFPTSHNRCRTPRRYRDHLRARRVADPAVPVKQLFREIKELGYTG